MIDKDPVRTTRREIRKLETLGEIPICVLCAYIDPASLVAVTVEWALQHGVARSSIEMHHASGKANDPHLIVALCRNCHGKATEGLLRAGVSMRPTIDPNELHARRLEGLASFRDLEGNSLRQWAADIRRAAAS